MDAMFYENGFYLTSKGTRISNILSHYEIYKKIIDIPGDVIELGVFRGGSIIQFATYRELLENENSRKIWGFDVFGTFPAAHNEADEKFRIKWVKETGGEFLTKEELERSFSHKNIGNIELIKGDIADTIPIFLKENPNLRIALLHIDTDTYEPAKIALNYLYNRVVKNGIILLDDYTVAGETKAAEEFLQDKKVELHKLPISQHKPSFFIKNEWSSGEANESVINSMGYL